MKEMSSLNLMFINRKISAREESLFENISENGEVELLQRTVPFTSCC